MVSRTITPIPFAQVAMDHIGPFTTEKNGYKYILCFICQFTRWAEAIPTYTCTAEETAKVFVNTIISRFGCPRTILSDRGTAFLNEVFKEITKYFDIYQTITTGYHPQCNGLVERWNGTLVAMISFYVNSRQDDWSEFLQLVLFAYRTSTQAAIKDTPAYLLYGRDLSHPIDIELSSVLSNEASLVDIQDYKVNLVNALNEIWALAK